VPHVDHLGDSDAAFSGQLLLDLFGGVRVGQVGVEVLVEHFGRLLAEVPALPARVQESRPQDHDGLAGALLQLDLETRKNFQNLFNSCGSILMTTIFRRLLQIVFETIGGFLENKCHDHILCSNRYILSQNQQFFSPIFLLKIFKN
jgi:hypothetical protein